MRQRIALWKQIYDTDDNAISKALSSLAWDLAAFTCLVELVRQAPATERGKRLNPMFMDMLVSGFWSNTMQGVRRLAERAPINGPLGVCSLGGLIDDARAARLKLTRRVFVEDIADLEYNYSVQEDRYWQHVFAQPAGEVNLRPRDINYEFSQQRHELFDWLSGTSPGLSHPHDVIREKVFDDLERRLQRLDAVLDHVNVEIAHAATEASRAGRVLERWGLPDAKDAVKELAQVAELVGQWFCFSGIGTVLPHPQFDQFEHLNEPLLHGEPDQLQQTWDTLANEMSQWHNIDPTQGE